MARSVSLPRNTAFVSYQSFEIDPWYCSECGETFDVFACKEDADGEYTNVCPNCGASHDVCYEEDQQDAFSNCVDYALSEIRRAFPSVTKDDKWLDREDHAFASNSFAYFGVSEYCGLVSVWMTPKEDYEQPGLQERWINQNGAKFKESVSGCFGTNLVKTATFSNGEAMFSAVGEKNKGELGLGRSSKCGWL